MTRSPWPDVPLSHVLSQYSEYVDTLDDRLYPKLSVRLYGRGVSLAAPAMGTAVRMKRHQIARAGQVILSEIWAKKGAIGIVPADGDGALCTSHFFLFDINDERALPGWIGRLLQANYLQPQLQTAARGSTGYAAVRPKRFLAATVPLPPLTEQRRIVARIEATTGRLRAAADRSAALEQEADGLLLSCYQKMTAGADSAPFERVARLHRRRVAVKSETQYPELGVRSFGKGTFHKQALTGDQLGGKRVYSIEPGDLVFNNVFAWEGAVAVARPEDRGRVGSHRFVTFVPDAELASAHFLCYHFLTQKGLEDLGKASPGSAGRNRTLGLKALARIEVPVPSLEQQLWFEQLVLRRKHIVRLRAQAAELYDAFTPALLAKAFRGEL